jgi:ABC-type sugar transport system ATPase subunit
VLSDATVALTTKYPDLRGIETTILSSADARRQGIAVIHQHPAIFPDLSVTENVFVGRQPRRMGGVDWAEMTRRARELLSSLRMEIDVRVPAKILSLAECQAIEIAKALSIDVRVLVMEIRLEGQVVRPRSPRHAMQLGISFLPEDRHQQGLVLQFPIRANETLPILRRLANSLGLVDRARETKIAQDFAARMRVVATGVEQQTNTLSGGNQQKVLLAKWLIPSPKVLILDEPMRGIDVGAKAEIHRIVSQLAAQGMGVILISDDAQEVIGMADRIIVFRAGQSASESVRASFLF